ncbi:MAG: alpha/beta hydrolase [Myxococcaceae bacterium]
MSLHVRDEGADRPLFLLHGLGASARVFDPLFDSKPGRRLIAVDLPNTARSGRWARSTPADIATELLKYADSHRVSAFSIFGHSFGGLIALELASRVPDRVQALTVASVPALGVPPELKLLLANPLADMTMGLFGRMPVWRPALRSYLSMIWGSASELTDAHLSLYEEAVSAPGFSEAMLEALRAVGEYRLPTEALKSGTFSKHVLWGEKDRLVHPMQGEQLARAIGAHLEVLNDVGHCLPEEAPARLGSVAAR